MKIPRVYSLRTKNFLVDLPKYESSFMYVLFRDYYFYRGWHSCQRFRHLKPGRSAATTDYYKGGNR